jgi:hypothetical protein
VKLTVATTAGNAAIDAVVKDLQRSSVSLDDHTLENATKRLVIGEQDRLTPASSKDLRLGDLVIIDEQKQGTGKE